MVTVPTVDTTGGRHKRNVTVHYAPTDLENQGEKKKVVSIVTREFEVDSNASDEMVLSTSKNHLTDSVESAEVGTVHESTVVGNRDGRSLIQQLGDLTANVSALDDKFSARIADLEAKHSAEIAALEAQMSTLLPFKAYFLDVREHTYLTHLRDFWTEYGAASRQKGRYLPNSKAAEIQGKISALNQVILHGGNAEVDALMLHERQPIPESKPFECLYGLRPETVRELGNPHLAAVFFFLLTHSNLSVERLPQCHRSSQHRRLGAL